MTAAHCADGASYFDIMAGAHNTLANDIALIELPSPMSFNDYIRPSCMPMAGDSADVGEMVTCTGWGKPSDSAGGISPVLRMVGTDPSSPTPSVTPSTESSVTALSALTPPEEREPATEIPAVPST